MYYINYYAQPRPKITEEEMIHEYERTRNVIRTKSIQNINDFDIHRNLTQRNINEVQVKHNHIIHRCRVINGNSHTTGVYNALFAGCYHTFRIPKQNGGYRTITAPVALLKSAQRDVLDMLVQDLKILPHNAAHGCVKHRSCLTALKVHQNNQSKWFLKVDLRDAFGSVNKHLLEEALKNNAVIYNIAHLGITASDITAVCMHNTIKGLPQGSPTSPMLLNLYLQDFDEHMTKTLRRKGIIYTRYVDDMLFSCRVNFNYTEVLELIRTTLPAGMYLNPEKTRYGNFNWKNWNLGIMYNNLGQLTVGYKNKKLIKNRIHNYNTHEELQTRTNFMQLNGILNYYKYIEPEYFNREQFTLVTPTQPETLTIEPLDIHDILEELW